MKRFRDFPHYSCAPATQGKTCTNHPWVEGVRGHTRDAVTRSSLCPCLSTPPCLEVVAADFCVAFRVMLFVPCASNGSRAAPFPSCCPRYWPCYTFSPSSVGLMPSEAGSVGRRFGLRG